ncbi:Fc.00g038580.m01.CDS01 [Cosmosporella sp. VM-42]
MPERQCECYMPTCLIKPTPHKYECDEIASKKQSAKGLQEEGGLRWTGMELCGGAEDEGQGGGCFDEDVDEKRDAF